MDEISTQMLVIGGGPAGYVAAIRAGQLGVDTVLVEESKLGGTCLNIGCIPSKALIEVAGAFAAAKATTTPFGLSVAGAQLDFAQALAWKDGIVGRLTSGVRSLLKKAKVKVLSGHAELKDGKSCIVHSAGPPTRVTAEHLVIATGSEPIPLQVLPFGGPVISSAGALALDVVPNRLAVIGAGYIGLELGTAFAKFGSKVTIIEAADRILPAWDRELTAPVSKRLAEIGVTVLLGTSVVGLAKDGSLLAREAGRETRVTIASDRVLVAVGRRARTSGFGLGTLDLAMDQQFIRVDARCATSMRNVWAIGDVTGDPMLAHRAMAQGAMVAEIVAGKRREFDHVAVPALCFTDPEVVSVGLSPEAAKSAGIDVVSGRFPFAASGRAMTQIDATGFVRITARADNHLVLGVQAVGQQVAELSAAFSLALEMGATLEDVAATIHAHPTRSEAFQESAMAGLGASLHV